MSWHGTSFRCDDRLMTSFRLLDLDQCAWERFDQLALDEPGASQRSVRVPTQYLSICE